MSEAKAIISPTSYQLFKPKLTHVLSHQNSYYVCLPTFLKQLHRLSDLLPHNRSIHIDSSQQTAAGLTEHPGARRHQQLYKGKMQPFDSSRLHWPRSSMEE